MRSRHILPMAVTQKIWRENTVEPTNLRNAGLKVTHPRKRILEILENQQNKHLTADDIYRCLVEANEDIGLATVYRVLNQFESAGLVEKHNFESGQAYYELDSGVNTTTTWSAWKPAKSSNSSAQKSKPPRKK